MEKCEPDVLLFSFSMSIFWKGKTLKRYERNIVKKGWIDEISSLGEKFNNSICSSEIDNTVDVLIKLSRKMTHESAHKISVYSDN